MPEALLILIGCVGGIIILAGVFWLAMRPPKREGRSFVAPRSGNSDEGGKHNEQFMTDS